MFNLTSNSLKVDDKRKRSALLFAQVNVKLPENNIKPGDSLK